MKRALNQEPDTSTPGMTIKWPKWMALMTSSALLVGGLAVGGAPPASASTETFRVVVGSSGVFVRSTTDISSTSNVIGGAFDGTTVRILCTEQGPKVKGPLGTSTLWNKVQLTKGGTTGFMNDSFVKTRSAKAVAPPCSGPASPSSPPRSEAGTTSSQAERSVYSYRFHIPIGDLDPTVLGVTPESITASYLRNFDREFQFPGCGPVVDDLKTCTLNVYGFQSPVSITAIWQTGFELKSLPGHPEGEGRYIDFNIVKGERGILYLDVNAYGKADSFWTGTMVGVFLNNKAVFMAWHDWADKLAKQHGLRTIDYAMGKRNV